jgi:hypothetical protein
MMVKSGIAGVFALLTLLIPVQVLPQARKEDQATLCRDDVMRLCMSAVPDRDRIVTCMKAQRASLSPGCQAVLDAAARDANHPSSGAH